MKLAESILEKLDPNKMQAHKDAIKYATERLGQAKLKLNDLKKKNAASIKLLDAKQNVEFWIKRVDDLTRRTKEA
jgi:hypothetical protein